MSGSTLLEPLEVTLSQFIPTQEQQEPDDSPSLVVIKATVRNLCNHPVTVLNWNSPLDPKAAVLGVFKVFELQAEESASEIAGSTIMFNRLPPTEDDFVELESGQEKTLEHKLLPYKLLKGKKYRITAVGAWMKVLYKSKKEAFAHDGRPGVEDSIRGEFQSNELVFVR